MNKDILVCGVGGQGTVLASKLIAFAFMKKNEKVHSAETIGMAQRGGSVTSHVRIGEAYSPLIPDGGADIILAFEPAEAVRNLHYLKEGGVVISNIAPTKPSTDALMNSGYEAGPMLRYLEENASCLLVDAEKLVKSFGSSKCFNTALLGMALSTGELGLTRDELVDAIKTQVKEKFIEMNIAVLDAAVRGDFKCD